MICRYYWNLQVENKQGSNEATNGDSRRTLGQQNTRRSKHFNHIFLQGVEFIAGRKDNDGRRDRGSNLATVWHRSFVMWHVDRDKTIPDSGEETMWTEGTVEMSGTRGHCQWGGPPCKPKSSMLLTCTPRQNVEKLALNQRKATASGFHVNSSFPTKNSKCHKYYSL